MGATNIIHASPRSRGLWVAAVVGLLGCADAGQVPPPGVDAAADGDAVEAGRVEAGDAVGDVANGGGIGDPCSADGSGGACGTGLTCLTERMGFPAGYCAGRCTAAGACPTGASCMTRGVLGMTCARRCASSRECRGLEGYECGGSPRVCRPIAEPLGTRDGEACFTVAPGAHALAPLPRRTFAGPNLSLSADRTDSVSEADGNLVVDPVRGAVATPYIAVSSAGSFIGTSAFADDAGVTLGRVDDPTQPWTADPLLVRGRDGSLYASFMGYRLQSLLSEDTRMWVARSMDDGARWEEARAVDPAGFCANRCDKPWLAAGPMRGRPDAEALYVAYQVERVRGEVGVLVAQRSEDGGRVWSAPATLAPVEEVAGAVVAPQLVLLAVDPAGRVHALYAGIAPKGGDVTLWGDPGARIVHRASDDGGATWGPPHSVARLGVDRVVYVQPTLALLGGALHVAYVSGTPGGAWDVVLATSRDGGLTWRHRRVNDDPEPCATHTLPAVAADPARGLVHVLWLENRFGDGAAAYAACPDDPSAPCGANERVSDASFTFNTSRDTRRWHGDYLGVAVDRGGVRAVWSDTRTGSPAVYAARAGAP